jgi:hypothetical protein
MDKKSLEEKAQDLAWEVSKRPSVYIKLVRLINKVALALGWIRSLFVRD